MKKLCLILCIVLAFCSCLSGCEASHQIENKPTAYPVVLGNHTVSRSPVSVGSLTPALTKMLLELGYNSRIVGYADGEVMPEPESRVIEIPAEEGFRWPWEKAPEPTYQTLDPLPRGALGTALQPNLEAIGEYKPELLFTTLPLSHTDAALLEEVGIQVIVISLPKTAAELSDLYRDLVGVMDGNLAAETTGQLKVDELNRQVNAVTQKIPENRKSVLYVKTLDPMVATGDSYEGALLSMVATNAADGYRGYRLSNEELAALNPDIILVDDTLSVENVQKSDRFSALAAVQSGQVYAVSGSLLTDRSLTYYQSLDALRDLIYNPPVTGEDPA